MTLIVASLFLPYTVEFEVSEAGRAADAASSAKQQDSTPQPSVTPSLSRPIRPGLSKNGSIVDGSSILKTMAKHQQLTSPEFYASANNSKTNLLLNEDELSRASVEDFFYHHPKLRRTSTPTSQLSSGSSTPQEVELDKTTTFSSQQHNALLRSALSSSTYIQPRARTPPVKNSSAVVDPTKKELQTPSLKVIPRTQSATNLAHRNQPSKSKSSLYMLNSKKELSSSEHIPTASYEAIYNDSGIDEEVASAETSRLSYDIPDKITPYGGNSNPYVSQFVSNRTDFFATAPFEVVKASRGNISLVKAVEKACESKVVSDDLLWVGTVGMPSDEVPESTREKIIAKLGKEFKSDAVFVDDVTFQGHYKSFCKQILWPSLHYQIPDNPKSKVFEEHSWKFYQKVNELFAKKIVSKYKEGDVIWVHDYHLLLVPQLVRKEIPNAKIGLFLHVSFPSSEVFRCFAQRTNILEGMLGANVISFQTEEYVRHFVQTCNRLLLTDFTDDGIKHDSRTIRINHFPVGIDAKSLKEMLVTSAEIKYWQKLIKQRWPNKKLIVTRDKVDRIRGIKQKLLAYEKFLTKNPEYLDEVILIQICLQNSNHDEDLESSISTIVDRINAKSNNISIAQPVVFLNQDIDFEQYLALLTEAETFIVSTMREGMNLTCHEFIVSTYEKHSPLILSEFTGSASILKKGAILINPWDIKQVSLAFEEALTKSSAEKQKDWDYLNSQVYQHDSINWVKNCVDSILTAWEEQDSKLIPSTLTRESFLAKYNTVASGKRVFVINLENLSSTVRYESSELNAVEVPRIHTILNNLTSDHRNVVYVMSCLRKKDLAARYRAVSNLGLIAENGGYVKTHDSRKWYSVSEENLTWKPAVTEYVNSIAERLPGSFVEVEDCTVRVHTENVRPEDVERKITLTGELITHINDVFVNDNVHATLVNKVVVIQQVDLPQKVLQLVSHSIGDMHVSAANHERTSSVTSMTDDETISSISFSADTVDKIGLLCIVGGQSATDEALFKHGIELENNKKVDDLLTIEVGKVKRSLANQYVGGINELLNILSKI